MIRNGCILCALVAGPLLASAAAPPAGNATGTTPSSGDAAESAAAADAASEETGAVRPSRPARLPTRGVQEEDIAAALDEETLWVEAADTRFLLVHRPPVSGAAAGSLLFLVDESGAPNARSRSALLRRGLAHHGWHTFFARLSDGPAGGPAEPGAPPRADPHLGQLRALLDGVRSAGPGGLTVLVVEGLVGHRVAPLASELEADGLILLNLPDSRVPLPASHAALSSLSLPALLVLESPLSWDSQRGLGPGVEVQRLPPGTAFREDDRVLRRIRGWLERRLAG